MQHNIHILSLIIQFVHKYMYFLDQIMEKVSCTIEDPSVLWNKIPSEIRNLSSLKQFKTSLNGKTYFKCTVN